MGSSSLSCSNNAKKTKTVIFLHSCVCALDCCCVVLVQCLCLCSLDSSGFLFSFIYTRKHLGKSKNIQFKRGLGQGQQKQENDHFTSFCSHISIKHQQTCWVVFILQTATCCPFQLCVCCDSGPDLVDEGSERCKHVSVGGFGQADFKEGQVNVKHFLHEGVVTFTVQQLGLKDTHTHARDFKYQYHNYCFWLG